MSFMTRLNIKIKLTAILAFCLINIIIVMIIASRYVNSLSPSEPAIIGTASNNVSFKVHYLKNSIFESGVRPQNLYYFMSFTDFIEIENSFLAEFENEIETVYKYTAAETLIIKQRKGSDSNTNPTVYEEKYPISEISGGITGKRITFSGKGADKEKEPGGVYVISPKKYIDIYKYVVEEHKKQMQSENVSTENALSFSADLLVEFSYNLRVKDSGINKTLTRGVIIPLSIEVFSPELTGTPTFELSAPPKEAKKWSPLIVMLLVLWFVAQIFGLSYALRQYLTEKDEYRRELNKILKKYSDVIVIMAKPVNSTKYEIEQVAQFQELLKLAANLNKHIRCFYDEKIAEFCVIDNGFVYIYELLFGLET